MTKPIIFDGHEHREMTDDELAAYEQLQRDVKNEQARVEAAAQAAAAAKASATKKLKTLGLTDDEIAALVG